VATSNLALTGRCLCGRVRYQAAAPLYAPTLCHCESCRRAQGAHVIAWVTVDAATLTFTAGQPSEYQSSPGVYRGFCGHCGSPVSYRSERRRGEVDLTLATLDDAGARVPVDHIWMEDALAWDRPADALPQFRRGRDA
jgi:hypothetical protein